MTDENKVDQKDTENDTRDGSKYKVSIVIPAFNEEENIFLVTKHIESAMRTIEVEWEVIFVDDGSSDLTWEEIERAGEARPNIRGIRLSRNFGHQHALLAGLSAARGHAVISMDADLQHPPSLLPGLIHAWQQGAKIVFTRRKYNNSASTFKKMSSKYFYDFFSRLAEVPLEEGASDFRLLDLQVLDTLLSFRDSTLFLRGAVQWVGYPSVTIEFEAGERVHGQTKYTLAKMLHFAWSGVLAFSDKPLRIGLWLGSIMGFLALVEVVFVLIEKIRGDTIPGWTSLMLVMSLLFSILFFVIGIIGAYVANMNRILQNRPRFIVEHHSNFYETSESSGASKKVIVMRDDCCR